MFDYRIVAGNPAYLGVTRIGKDINFAVVVRDERDCRLLLYKKDTKEMIAELLFTEEMRFGDIYAMKIEQFPMKEYEYHYRIEEEIVIDPYAKYVSGRETYGVCVDEPLTLRSGASLERFSWQGDKPLKIPYEECILYVTHVRGFTMDTSAKVRHPGTFAGVREKIPYLKRLGINQLELMPVYEFAELERRAPVRKHMPLDKISEERVNYWGYKEAYYFAPKASYSASKNPIREFKELVRELHKNGIELILEFYFPERTSPHLILDCIRYWVSEYHIDGVHVSGKKSVLLPLATDPHLSGTKLMSEYFPVSEIYEPAYQPTCRRLAEYNEDFLQKARQFLKGDEGMLSEIVCSMRKNPRQQAVINYMAGHNGFTFLDMVSFDVKHNEANGEENGDGSAYNYSCNYGAEGLEVSKGLQKLRRRQLRNAFLLLLLSQGVPAIYGGDEMGNSQKGNNNVWCQDNELSWIQWSRKKDDKRLTAFVQEAIRFRKASKTFGRREEYRMKDYLSKGMPDLSYHGKKAWYGEFEHYNRQIGILYAGCYTREETCYVLYNMHMVEHELALPMLPPKERWYIKADTMQEEGAFYQEGEELLLENQKMASVPPRTIMILVGKKDETD